MIGYTQLGDDLKRPIGDDGGGHRPEGLVWRLASRSLQLRAPGRPGPRRR